MPNRFTQITQIFFAILLIKLVIGIAILQVSLSPAQLRIINQTARNSPVIKYSQNLALQNKIDQPSFPIFTFFSKLIWFFVTNSFLEEFLFRGTLLYFNLHKKRWWIISSLLFASAHFVNWEKELFFPGIIRFTGLFLDGYVYSHFANKFNSIVPGVLAHALHNFLLLILVFIK